MSKKLIFTEKQEKDIIDNYLISRNSRSVANLFDISQTTVRELHTTLEVGASWVRKTNVF